MTYAQQSQEQRSPCTPGRRFKPSVISPLATPCCVLTQSKPQRSDLVQPAGLTLVRDSVSSASTVQTEYPHLHLSTPTQTVQFSRSVMCYSLRPHGLSTPGLPVLHYLPEYAQTHVRWVSDAIQLSHPLSPSSLPGLNFSGHLGLFQWVGSLHQMAQVLRLQLQHQSFQWIFRVDFL